MRPATPTASHAAGLGRDVIVISLVAVFGAIMSILDATIVNVAIATLARDFNSSLSRIQWVSTGYLLALAMVIPLTGWAADRFGAKRIYMLSVILFVSGSALSGLAWSAETLIGFRIVQGLGGGMILPAAITVVSHAAGPQRIGRAMSIVGVPAMLAPILGPVLGGWIVSDFSWRWIFYVNVPVGVLALALAHRFIPAGRAAAGDRLDILGLALLSPGLTALVYGLAETPSAGGVGSPRVMLGLGAGAALVAAFVVHALRTANPLLDLRLFGRRAVAAASATTFLFAVAFFGTLLLLPLYFQIARGESALAAGLQLAPRGVGAAITLPVAGRLVDRSGAGKVVPAGLVILAAATLPWTHVGISTSRWLLGGLQLAQGLGMGLAMQPAMAAAYQALDRAAVARATSALNSIQRIGGSIGTAVLAIVLQHQISGVVPGATGGSLNAIAQAPVGAQERLAEAFARSFWWAFALTVLTLVPALFLPRTGPNATIQPTAAPRSPPARLTPSFDAADRRRAASYNPEPTESGSKRRR